MSIFKKKIYFGQFLADVITFQFDFLEENFAKMIVLADESKVLTDNQKEEFLDKAHELIIADIMRSCEQDFCKSLSSDEIGAGVGQVYVRYLTEYKKVPKALADQKAEKVSDFLGLICRVEDEAQEREEHNKKIGYSSYPKCDNQNDRMKLHLCHAFRNYCVGHNIESENREGRGFAAFKFAMALVKGDIVGQLLKQYSVSF